jgi:hypothetical protein
VSMWGGHRRGRGPGSRHPDGCARDSRGWHGDNGTSWMCPLCRHSTRAVELRGMPRRSPSCALALTSTLASAPFGAILLRYRFHTQSMVHGARLARASSLRAPCELVLVSLFLFLLGLLPLFDFDLFPFLQTWDTWSCASVIAMHFRGYSGHLTPRPRAHRRVRR